MQLFQQASNGIKSNTELPITTIISDIDFKIQKYTTYNEIVRTYDQNLIQCLKSKGCLNEKIIVIEVSMFPEDMHWIIWKSFNEIYELLTQLGDQIQTMKKVEQFKLDKNGRDTSSQISIQFNILKQIYERGIGNFTEDSASRFVAFMNKIGEQLYLRKTIPFLIFIGHCISIDKWPVMIHHQSYIYKDPVCFGNKIMGYFGNVQNKKEVDFFITVASDGILISDDHLLLSKVRTMIPFTNQMKISCDLTADDNLIYEIKTGKISSLVLNFYKSYERGINFGCGLGRALKYAGYNFLMGIDLNQEINSSQLGFSGFVRTNAYVGQNRFNSFAQIRQNSNCKMYSDGCGYYEDLYNELMKAEKQVCITGWMITPYFLLKRPGNINDEEYRLDGVLCRLAQRGVKIFIIVFMEPFLVNNDSEHVQKHMQSLHKNIKVYRHPNVAVPQLWSHHQKMVVIDQKIGFMGGLDICYGRWDTHEHSLVEQRPCGYWDGQQFNNYRLKDIYTPRQFWKSNLNKDFQPRMPWHDIAVQIRGDVVIDLLRHFVQYWYFVKSQLSTDPRVYFGILQRRLSQATTTYQQAENSYLLNQLKNDTQENFAQKFNSWKQSIGYAIRGEEERSSELFIEQRAGMNAGNLRIQMLRSASQWSIGLDLKKWECSIHNAYIDLIEKSQSHIYIENQFFMGLQNKIVETLANRIIKAKRTNTPFRIVIIMPLLPGFEGYIGDPAATVLRIQMHWQYQAISRSQNSLFQRLLKEGFSRNDIDRYVYFFGLRKGEVLNKIPVTEIIYVHSKLMIVDDKKIIVGSANINDRSLLGNRDSEIAICIEDDDKKQTYSFRRKVFEEHFGLKPTDSIDINDDVVWDRLLNIAKKNTQIFRNVFGCIPDDYVSKIPDIEPFQEKHADIGSWFSISKQIQGHAVTFPLQFMSKEDLTFKLNQKEYYAPDHTFT